MHLQQIKSMLPRGIIGISLMVSVFASSSGRRFRADTPQVQLRRLRRQRTLLLVPWAIAFAPIAVPLWLWLRARRKAGSRASARLDGGTRVVDLGRYLWIGASAEAKERLKRIVEDVDAPAPTRMEAACRLAERLHFEAATEEAEALLARMPDIAPNISTSRDWRVLAAFLSLEKGRAAEAADHLAAIPSGKSDTGVELLRASTETEDSERIQAINRVLQGCGLAALRLNDPDQALSLVNVACDRPPDAPTAGHVSVIMPIWNAEATIEAALRSILSQTYRDLSVIVVDDCSTDRSAALAEGIAAQDPRVRVLRQSRNNGAYAARNRGLAEATGEFVTTHDADDWSHPERIARQVAVLAKRPEVIGVLTDWVRVTPDLRVTPGWRLSPDPISRNFSSFLFRLRITNEIGGWDEVRFGADSEFVSRCSARYGADTVVITDAHVPLAFGLDAPDSLTRGKDTHISSFFYGKRQIYAEAGANLHRSGNFGPNATKAKARVLPATFFDREHRDSAPDRLLVGDCRDATVVRHMARLLDDSVSGASNGKPLTVGILHRPDFVLDRDGISPTDPFSDEWFALISRPNARPVTPEDAEGVSHRVELLALT